MKYWVQSILKFRQDSPRYSLVIHCGQIVIWRSRLDIEKGGYKYAHSNIKPI